MRIGVQATRTRTVDDAISFAAEAATAGLDHVWFPQFDGLDAVTVAGIVGRAVPGIGLGTAVVPIQGRHPQPLALAALTAADAAGEGRFTLGLGVTHPLLSERVFGVPYAGIVDRCTEVLEALEGLLGAARRADVDGRFVSVHATTSLSGPAPGVVLAAMGRRMLELAGRATDGTITWMTGPRTLEREVVPRLSSAARAAGRAAPRVIAGVHVGVTGDPAGLRERAADRLARSATMPAYARQVAAEGILHPIELTAIGSEEEIAERLSGYAAAGATELCVELLGDSDGRAATIGALGRIRQRTGPGPRDQKGSADPGDG